MTDDRITAWLDEVEAQIRVGADALWRSRSQTLVNALRDHVDGKCVPVEDLDTLKATLDRVRKLRFCTHVGTEALMGYGCCRDQKTLWKTLDGEEGR